MNRYKTATWAPTVERNGSGGIARPGAASVAAARTGRNGSPRRRYVLITGGAGFIGTNLAKRLLDDDQRVMVLDNFSRPGVEANMDWLVKQGGSRLSIYAADVRDERAVRYAVASARKVYHFAAQVAVTTSLENPQDDFETNAQGTLNVLESVRRQSDPPPVLFTSTNKVYGDLAQVELMERSSRYEPTLRRLEEFGIHEAQPLDLYSPYGCSKGAADQYMLDYARCFRLPALVFRMSCIYGPHQCGNEDQGWVAHFLLQALRGEPITIYGDGKQVRDVLYVDDLVEAMVAALDRIEVTRGKKFNIGGGPTRAVSLLELIELIRELHPQPVDVRFEPWRVGDQRYYVSDTRSFEEATGWRPRVPVERGVAQLRAWLEANRVHSLVTNSQTPIAEEEAILARKS